MSTPSLAVVSYDEHAHEHSVKSYMIMNSVTKRCLFARKGSKWGGGFGAELSSGFDTEDRTWRLVPSTSADIDGEGASDEEADEDEREVIRESGAGDMAVAQPVYRDMWGGIKLTPWSETPAVIR